ncbi:hypothetical protein ACHAXH_007134 [Discostella pseudostelligera]
MPSPSRHYPFLAMPYLSAMLSIVVLCAILLHGVDAYSIGDVDPRALRGIWRLTSLDDEGLPFERNKKYGRGIFHAQSAPPSDPRTIWQLRGFLPMKEFTTYPKKKQGELENSRNNIVPPKKQTEIFIKLKDDHTFEQCKSLFSDGKDASSLEEELELEVSKREKESFALKGTWDFVDGNLILAADRPEKKPFSLNDDDTSTDGDGNSEADTILVGKVSVQSEASLTENPALEKRQQNMSDQDALMEKDPPAPSSLQPRKGLIDIHLSVPKGKIKTGKFMYPKTHPSFFEQPIVRPISKGHFELRQILGDYNAKLADEGSDSIELFRKDDLVGKRFYLTTFPLPKRRKKLEKWDATSNTYVQFETEPTKKEKREEDLKPGKNMQVVAVELFANNTFSTLHGLGSSTVLRGKWSIIGDKRDQLWMMVYRFGFGRSVSGSTFSEGTSLTQNDEKGYWGVISEVEDGGKGSRDGVSSIPANKKIEIHGAVMVGWGLEPCSVGRFKMIEIDELLEDDDDDGEEEEDGVEEEEEYVEMSADAVAESANNLDSMLSDVDSALLDSSNPFDFPGAFE